MKLLAWAAVAVAAVMVTGSLPAYGYYWRLQNAVRHEDADKLIGGNRPKKLNSALNILVLGSDTREGANARYGRGLRNKPPSSDTMVLLHLSPGGGQALAVSFPRDLVVPIPTCTRKDGTKAPGTGAAMLNTAIARAGPTCTMKTIEQITKIRIDHFAQVDFVGFKRIAGVGNLSTPARTVSIRYGTGAEPQARALAELLPGARSAPRAKTPAGVVDVVLGTGFAGIRTSGVPVQQGESRASEKVCEKVA